MQARTGSRRLPGKALLDFQGWPISVLVARRAANRGARVLLATSDASSDDALARLGQYHGINVVRGPLDDVLARFVLALGNEPDDAPVVRLTADNLLPDGALIADAIECFEERKLDYLTTGSVASGLPYGCSLEVTCAKHIRNASQKAQNCHDKEHVTPLIRRWFGETVFTKYADLGCGHLRSTIDCLDDYEALYHATPYGVDLTQLQWQAWVDFLRKSETAPRSQKPVRDLILGTAQLGMPYGIARAVSPNETECLDILRRAITEGVAQIDTARAYGASEVIIGKLRSLGWDARARVVTKLSPMQDVPDGATPATVELHAENSLLNSCLALNCEHLDCVLLHRASHLHAWSGAVFSVLRNWQKAGRIRTLGVSVQTPKELKLALGFGEVEHIQLPCNILDHRWDLMLGDLRLARSERELTVHVRSVLLQGLLNSRNTELWQRAHVAAPTPIIDWLSFQAAKLGRDSIVSLCLGWARGLDWADGVVVGCDTIDQLNDTVRIFNLPALSHDEIDTLAADRPYLDPRSLDPSQWVAPKLEGAI